ncbi:VWA domain-containing protein [Vibrio breoganii]|uniref:VWA domain-containing protein n=11 Tax=Vibrio breoganii TaxID=553239 RepID=UPI0039B0B809
MDSISFAQDVVAGDAWLIVDAQGNLKIAPLDYVPQEGDVILSVGENPLTVPEDIVTELRVSIAQQNSIQSVDAQSGIQGVLDSLEQGGDPTAEDGNDPQSGDDEGSSLTATGAVERDGAQTIATTDFQTEGVFPAGFTPEQSDAVTELIVQTVALLAVSTVSLTDNNGEEVINGEGETATIKGFLGGNSETLESLIITDSENQQIEIDPSQIVFDGNGNYEVTGIDVAQLADGVLTVVASGSDGDGNPVSVTDTVEKDFTYGDDGDDEGTDITPPFVSLTDNTEGEDAAENEVINESEQATITGYLGEGGKTLDSLVITGPGGEPIDVDLDLVTIDEDGYYTIENIDVSGFDDGILTVTAQSTDVDGNKATVTDAVEKDFTYGDDGDDEGDDIAPPSVSLTDNNPDEEGNDREIINGADLVDGQLVGEPEKATVTGYLGEGVETLDSLVITDSEGTEIVIAVSDVTINPDGTYAVNNDVDVSGLLDGELTVTAKSTDVDGNKATVTDTVVKDFTYGDDGDDEGSDIAQPTVSLTDNNPDEEGNDREIINGADLVDGQLVGEPEKATVTGYLGEGVETLDSLVITDSEGTEIVIAVSDVTINPDGTYAVNNDVDVSGLLDGELTVTAKSTDVDGNKATVTDTVVKDFTYGDDGEDEGDDIAQPSVSLTDNNPDEEGNDREIINGADLVDGQLVGEPEKATVTGYLGEGVETLDSLVITDSEGTEIVIAVSDVTINPDGTYAVNNDVDVSGLLDGELTVTAQSTDVDGNKATVTDTVVKDFTYGDDGEDEGDDIAQPSVSLTDNNPDEEGNDREIINGADVVDGELVSEPEKATVTGYLGEGVETLDSLVITDSEGTEIVIAVSDVTINPDGTYAVNNDVDVSGLLDGELTVTAKSTDVDGNKATVTDTVVKDFTYGDDGDDEGSDIAQPTVSLTDNNPDEDGNDREIINGADLVDGQLVGEPEKATVTGYLGEGVETLDSLVITDSEGTEIVIAVSDVTINPDGTYAVNNDVDVSGLLDGELTVTAQSTDVDGNKATVTDTVVKDFTYGDDGEDEGDDIAQPTVSLTDNNPDEDGNDREIINGADLVDGQLVGEPEKATVTGYLGEGVETLDSLVITDSEGTEIVIAVSDVTINPDGTYAVNNDVDVSGLLDGELTVTAKSTDVDGNKATVTDTVVKDFTYGDDGEDEGDDIAQPSVSLTDNNPDEEGNDREIINGADVVDGELVSEPEKATVTGYLGEGVETLDSLVITDSEGTEIVIAVSDVTINPDGTYAVNNDVDVSGLLDGELTVTAKSTDVDGNKATVTDTVVKDFTYGDDGDDEGSDIAQPTVSLTDNNPDEEGNNREIINGADVVDGQPVGDPEKATITGYLGEGGKTLDSLIISGPGGDPIEFEVSEVTVDDDGYYEVQDIDVSGFDDGVLTVTAKSTDVDGNKATVTDTVVKDFTYGDDDDNDDTITQPTVSLTDDIGEEEIDGTETATITGYIGEGGLSLDSVVITDEKGETLIVELEGITLVDGNYIITGVDVGDLSNGELTVTANSTDIDGNKASVTDDALKAEYAFVEEGSGDQEINGDDRNEIIIGDTTSVIGDKGEDLNIVILLDRSGSMRGDAQIGTAKTQIIQAFNKIVDSAVKDFSGNANIMLAGFAGSTSIAFAVNLGADDETRTIDEIKADFAAAVNAIEADGSTNYAEAFDVATEWLEDQGASESNPGVTLFITDGQPNRDEDEDEGAFDSLDDISNVVAIGLDLNDDGKTTLNTFDSDGSAEFIVNVDGLAEAIEGEIFETLPGKDTISSDGGRDILFGDTISFDGIEGQGVEALKNYVVANSDQTNETITTKDVFDYITENANEFNISADNHEGDTLVAGDQDDILYGQGGNDILDGSGGNDLLFGGSGDDTMTGGTGADTFVWTQSDLSEDGSIDVIKDFSLVEGDRVDLRDLFPDVNEPNDIDALISGFVDTVEGDDSSSSFTVEVNGNSLSIEFEGVSSTDLISDLQQMVVLTDA